MVSEKTKQPPSSGYKFYVIMYLLSSKTLFVFISLMSKYQMPHKNFKINPGWCSLGFQNMRFVFCLNFRSLLTIVLLVSFVPFALFLLVFHLSMMCLLKIFHSSSLFCPQPHILFSLHFCLGSFSWPMFKLTDVLLNEFLVQCETHQNVLHLCYSVLKFCNF